MSIYQIAVKGTFDSSEQLRNIHHYEFAGYVPSDTELQEFVDNFDAVYKQRQSNFHQLVTFNAYDVRRVDVGDLPTIEYVPTAGSWSGGATQDAMPPQSCALVTWKAQTVYPRSTRSYLFPFGEASNSSGGQLLAGTLDTLTIWAANLLEITITGQLNADKVAVEYGGTPRVVVAFNEVSLVIVSKEWATQRRRRRGVGS